MFNLAAQAAPFIKSVLPTALRGIGSLFKGSNAGANIVKGIKAFGPNIAKGLKFGEGGLSRFTDFLTRGIGTADKIAKGVDMARQAGLIPANQSSTEQALRRGVTGAKRLRSNVGVAGGKIKRARQVAERFDPTTGFQSL